QPIGNVGHNAGPPDIHEMLELVERKEANAAALDQFPQTDALAYRVAARPKRVAKLIQQRFGKALDCGPRRHFCDQYRNFDARLVVEARMEARKVGNDRGLPATALADKWAAVRLGGGVVTVEARLDSGDRRFEEWVFNQDPFATIHRLRHCLRISSDSTSLTGTLGKSRFASKTGSTSSSEKVATCMGSGERSGFASTGASSSMQISRQAFTSDVGWTEIAGASFPV